MTNITKAQEARAEKSLNTKVRYKEGVMTRKEWINLQYKNGKKVEQSEKNRLDFNRAKYNRMTNYQEQEEYERKCEEKVICYNLYVTETSFYNITKAEFDYFNTLKN